MADEAESLLDRTVFTDDRREVGTDDTNADILPSKRTKKSAGADDEPEKEQMSKRKRRKLEQLKQKRELREMRDSVLSELKTVQLKPEQAEMMRASHSIRTSRKAEVAMARKRLKAGLPLLAGQEKLRKKRPKASGEGEGEGDDDEGSSSSGDIAGEGKAASSRSDRRTAHLLAAGTKEIRNMAEPKTAASTPMPKAQPKLAAASASATGQGGATKETAQPASSSSGAAAAAKAKAKAKAEVKKAAENVPPPTAPQPLVPVRVSRTEKIEEQRSKLPAVMAEQELVETVLGSDVTLVCGDTGCGKSTQVPQFLYEAGICNGGEHLIAVTQPRRVAAIAVSQRVGDELNDMGTVGYQVRYDKTHDGGNMRIKFMTDGILLREVQNDFLCKKYTCIIIDEAHERGVNCDILIGLLSRVVQRRRRDFDLAMAKGAPKAGEQKPLPPLRLIVMSATLRLCDFTENRQLFPTAPPVVNIDGRTFPVTLHFARKTDEDYIKAAKQSVLKIHKQLPPGTILVFVTGREEVRRLCRILKQAGNKPAKEEAAEDEEDAVEDEDDVGRTDMLDGSDDEGGVFDDDLDKPVNSEGATEERGSGKKKLKKKSAGEAAPSKKAKAAGAGADDADDDEKVEDREDEEPQDEADESQKGTRKKKKVVKRVVVKKKKKAAGAKDEEVHDQAPAETAEAAPGKHKKKGKKSAQAAEKNEDGTPVLEEELDINYRLDAEEDVQVLDPESAANEAENLADAKAKQAKKERMSKLDKSRTAGGVFKGSGFGEGKLIVLPLYAQLPAREQLAPFQAPPDGARVVVVSTNVAETSVTLPNVRYVVDSGYEKRKIYKQSSGVSAFQVCKISKAASNQRAGRAGRLGPGHTYRLYSAAAYENHFSPFAPIAMLHTPMDPVLLLLSSLGVPRLDVFPWPTPPSHEAVLAAIHRLRVLSAIADNPNAATAAGLSAEAAARSASSAIKCTPLGLQLAQIPVAPRYARMLLASITASEGLKSHIIGHACALVAAFSVGNLTCWESVNTDDTEVQENEHELARLQKEAALRLHEAQAKTAPRWSNLRDDSEGLLWLMGGYAFAAASGEQAAERFCTSNRVNHRQMMEAHSLMQQLGTLLQRRLSLDDLGIDLQLPIRPRPPDALQAQRLRDCIVEGLMDRVAILAPELGHNVYVAANLGKTTPVYVHNSSNIFRYRPRPKMLVFNEIISSNTRRRVKQVDL
eukprot:TRINITY_DN38221_c0_g1_i2.p1 TRINITY_DN38221_c0_g1~~TRINITY_DN38221_c0_g1_i2.p1  ORF type:complete len:1212 (-),score=332.07 TRINITY_DN38221_c0_g1_i2:149-3784(-)